MTERQKSNIAQSILAAFLFVGTAAVMVAPRFPLIRKVSEYSVHLMLGMLLFSMIAMVLNKSKAMFAGLACTAALCIFLKNASNNVLKLPEANTEPKLNVAHINLSNITYEIDSIEVLLQGENIDLISFQELTPDWNLILNSILKVEFPYSKSEVRIDPYGMAIYSRLPFISSDTFLTIGLPNMDVIVEKDNRQFEVITSYLIPALDNKSIVDASNQLKTIASKINNSEMPVIALGEFNMVYWTNEIRQFRSNTKLKNSRRDLAQGNLRVPYDHIFFSEALECTQFKELRDQTQNYIGIMGTYQIKGDQSFDSLNSQLSFN